MSVDSPPDLMKETMTAKEMDKEFKKDFWYPIPKFNIPKPEEFNQ